MPRGTYMTGQNRQWWRETRNPDARKNAAHHLALVARRYLNDRATGGDVGEAIQMWWSAAQPEVKVAPETPADPEVKP